MSQWNCISLVNAYITWGNYTLHMVLTSKGHDYLYFLWKNYFLWKQKLHLGFEDCMDDLRVGLIRKWRCKNPLRMILMKKISMDPMMSWTCTNFAPCHETIVRTLCKVPVWYSQDYTRKVAWHLMIFIQYCMMLLQHCAKCLRVTSTLCEAITIESLHA